MKRDLLAKSLQQMNAKPPSDEARPTTSAAPAIEGGPKSLRSMSEVLSQVSAQAAQEVDLAEIADSEISDRFDVADGLDELVESIRASGQQLPALLRYRRGAGPRYEVVYGRRRIAACRILGIKVKAYIKEMDKREALVSQALENSARLERSFIEQAVFAARLEDNGFSRSEIGDVLAVDKGTLSKLISVARDVPEAVVYRIGAAHDAGRRPWLELRRLVKLDGATGTDKLLALIPNEGSPAAKLEALVSTLQLAEMKASAQSAERKGAPPRAPLSCVKDTSIAFKANGQKLLIEVSEKKDKDFIAYVESHLERLYWDWKGSR